MQSQRIETLGESPATEDVELALSAFYADVDACDLQPLWNQTTNLMPGTPQPQALPWLWRGEVLQALARRAEKLVTIERGGERRVLALANPGLGGAPYATPTLWGAIQVLGPHETAPAHRHSASAIRFVLEGEGVWTTVDGDASTMHPGDLVLTPAWTFHDHHNSGDQTMLWFDGLDIPLVRALDAMFYENHPQLSQQVAGFDLSEQRYGRAGIMSVDRPTESPHSPLYVYRWAESDALLGTILENEGGPIATVEFFDPRTGGVVLPTLSCRLHRIIPGGRTLPTRKAGSSVFVVFRGQGTSVIVGQRFDWTQGDMFVVPSWCAVEHEAEAPSDLFELSDAAVLQALHLFRSEKLEEHQEVVSVFDPKDRALRTEGHA